ncbi:hypothetical protein P691DRAFT_806520 [Macrolepiota fuliginosa MF-IS2]|uniref:Secreted protein n=1 Tax=Macrolepiota fuliginosa MF-IS2 TaxID=1400762 RepID=A0A9P5XK40_9AGAR|nr:hypothetical protein P691DRAFT_806520 [Macrolepiota fuliginosa MF-IS2]
MALVPHGVTTLLIIAWSNATGKEPKASHVLFPGGQRIRDDHGVAQTQHYWTLALLGATLPICTTYDCQGIFRS